MVHRADYNELACAERSQNVSELNREVIIK